MKGHESVGVGGGVFCSFTFFSGAVAVLVVLPGVFGFGHGFWGTRFPHVVLFWWCWRCVLVSVGSNQGSGGLVVNFGEDSNKTHVT